MRLPSSLKTVASILLGTMIAWMLSAFVPDPADAFFAPHAPTLSFSPAAGYEGTDAINPDTAPVGTPLTFSLVYTHQDNHPPVIVAPVLVRQGLVRAALAHDDNGEEEAIKLFVNTAPGFPFFFTELKLHRDTTPDPVFPLLHDGDYTNGEQFTATVPAGFPYAANYEFYFQATDGEWGHFRYLGRPFVDGPFSFTLTAPLPSNHAPTLSFSQDPGYLTDGVNPDKGDLNSPFEFRVVYQDQDNDAPGQMRLIIERENTVTATFDPYLENALLPADPSDTNYADGREYKFTVSFPQGINYRYHFEASDGEEAVRLPATEYLNFSVNRQPVILVPGIIGSELFHHGEEVWMNTLKIALDDHFLDSLALNELGDSFAPIDVGDIIREKAEIFEIWTDLIGDLRDAGYVEGQDLFVFPYDWRLDNRLHADGLANLVNHILQNNSASKVDIIAHSMGGLVTKEYLRQNGENKVDQVIFLGTPHAGAPKALKALLWGDDFGTGGILNPQSIKRIAGNMRALYQLLPTQAYFDAYTSYVVDLGDIDHNGVRRALNFDQTQTFIGNMSLNAYLRDIANVFHADLAAWSPSPELQTRMHAIVGCAEPTIGRIVTFRGFEKDDISVQLIDGDETVPLDSAVGVASSAKYYIKGARHGRMPNHATTRELVLDILHDNQVDLSENRYDSIRDGVSNCGYTATLHSVHSPIDLHAYDSLGNHTGPNSHGGIDEEIPGSSYDVLGDSKFLVLPKGLNATITMDGTGAGTFRYDLTEITEQGEQMSARFFELPVTSQTKGEVVFDEQNIAGAIVKLDQDGDGQFEQIFTPSSVLDPAGTADFIPPVINITDPAPDAVFEHHQILTIQSGITDDTAPITTVVGLDGITATEQESPISPLTLSHAVPLPILSLGSHSLSINAHDAAGNYAATSTSFTIIATPASVLGLIEWGRDHGWYRNPATYKLIKNLADKLLPLTGKLPPSAKRAKLVAIDALITLLDKLQKQGMITAEARDVLTGDLRYVRGHL